MPGIPALISNPAVMLKNSFYGPSNDGPFCTVLIDFTAEVIYNICG